MLKEFRKTATIKAEQFDGSKRMMDEYEIDEVSSKPGKKLFAFETVEGPFWLYVGDWIATDDDGSRWVINDDWFRRTYEEIADDKGLLQYLNPSFKHYTIEQSDCSQEIKDAAGQSDCSSEIKDAAKLMGINISDSDVNRIKDLM